MTEPILEPVVEIFGRHPSSWVRTPTKPWPAAVTLSARTAPDEVALVMHTLSTYVGPDANSRSPEEIAASSRLKLPGGLRATIGTRSIPPSCCCGLETWREWFELLGETTDSPWLGHDPSPWVEITAAGYVVWSDGGLTDSARIEPGIPFSRHQLEAALRGVDRDLRGFLDVLRVWSMSHLPSSASGLVESFDRAFHVSEPVPGA